MLEPGQLVFIARMYRVGPAASPVCGQVAGAALT